MHQCSQEMYVNLIQSLVSLMWSLQDFTVYSSVSVHQCSQETYVNLIQSLVYGCGLNKTSLYIVLCLCISVVRKRMLT